MVNYLLLFKISHREDHYVNTPISEFEGLDRFFYVVYPLGFALRATTQHVGKAGGLQILRCQGFEVNYYIFILDALTLKPSGFCNVRVNRRS